MLISSRLACTVCLLGMSANTLASEPSTLFLGGAEFSSGTSYDYLGQIAPLSEDLSNTGFVRKIWIDWLKYSYTGAGNQTYYASAPGAAFSLGYRQSNEFHQWGAYLGLVYRDTNISPVDPTSTVSGSMLRPQLQLDGEQTIYKNWKVAFNGSYIEGEQAYWANGKLLREIWSGQQIGLEVIKQGDPSYSAHQFGVLWTGLKFSDIFNFGFEIGTSQVTGQNSYPYFGIQFGRMY